MNWWTKFWHPTAGCVKCSPACDNCWATGFAWRFSHHGNPKISERFAGVVSDAHTWTEEIRCNQAELFRPETWRQPQRVFVSPVGDLALAPAVFVGQVYQAMAQYHQHTYIVCTKRPGMLLRKLLTAYGITPGENVLLPGYSIANIWHLTTVENQEAANQRIPELLAFRRYGHWPVLGISAEPLLGPLDLSPYLSGLDWIIAGGESGPAARPMHPAWIRGMRDQAQRAGVPFFFKQWGSYLPYRPSMTPRGAYLIPLDGCLTDDVTLPKRSKLIPHYKFHQHFAQAGETYPFYFRRLAPESAGRQLDDRTWEEVPECQSVIPASIWPW